MAKVAHVEQFHDNEEERRRCASATPAIAPDTLRSLPRQFLPRDATPDSIAGWQALADGFLTTEACAFHRNVEITSRYAWVYKLQPTCFKWAGMAAIASHHVRHALFPLRLDADRGGYVDLPRSMSRRGLLMMKDVNTIRATNNGIFDDIFWVHLAYATAPDDDGIERLRDLLRPDGHYAPVLSGFETIDRGRRVLEGRTASEQARREATELIWEGNLQLLDHEQRALVQPHFDRLSSTFARLASIGSATRFEVRGLRSEGPYFTSFYLYSLAHGAPHLLGGRSWPRITCFEDRWGWLSASVVPRYRRFDAEAALIDASLRRIFDEAREHAATPCVPPRPEQAQSPRRP